MTGQGPEPRTRGLKDPIRPFSAVCTVSLGKHSTDAGPLGNAPPVPMVKLSATLIGTCTAVTHWFDPAYVAAGNMTEMPCLAGSSDLGMELKYDARNRLVEVYDPVTGETVATSIPR